MKTIINGKKYDTEFANRISMFNTEYLTNNHSYENSKDRYVYRTFDGRLFIKEETRTCKLIAVTETELKKMLVDDVDMYEEIFGEIKEEEEN